MKLSHATSLVLGLGIVSAAPSGLEERAPSNAPINLKDGPDFTDSFDCGLKTYTGKEIYLSAQHSVNLELVSETRGKAKYPHRYKNFENLDFPSGCPADENLKEFPLVSPAPYDGGKNNKNAGEERVVYYWVYGDTASDGNPNAVYCGIMTHTGADPGSFVLC